MFVPEVRIDPERAGPAKRPDPRTRGGREPLSLHQSLMQSRASSSAEDRGGHVEDVHRIHVPTAEIRKSEDPVSVVNIPLGRPTSDLLLGREVERPVERSIRRPVRRRAGDLFHHRARVDIAGDADDRVVRDVESTHVRKEILPLDRGHRTDGSQNRTFVRCALQEFRREQVGQFLLRAVLLTSDLLHHHLPLPLDLLRIEDTVHHSVEEHVEYEGEIAAGDHRVVRGVLRCRERVVVSSKGFDDAIHLADIPSPRALEEHVLRKMGESGALRTLIHRAHADPKVCRYKGYGMYLFDEYGQSVRKDRPAEGKKRRIRAVSGSLEGHDFHSTDTD